MECSDSVAGTLFFVETIKMLKTIGFVHKSYCLVTHGTVLVNISKQELQMFLVTCSKDRNQLIFQTNKPGPCFA